MKHDTAQLVLNGEGPAHQFGDIYELRKLVKRLADSVFARFGHDRLKLFDTCLLLLAVKAHDETTSAESAIPTILAADDDHIEGLFAGLVRKASQAIGCELPSSEKLLDGPTIRYGLTVLSPYRLARTSDGESHADIFGTVYQEIVSSTFRGTLGAYFTPKPIADLAAQLLSPRPEDSILDMCCGSGTFLLSAYALSRDDDGVGSVVFGCDIQDRMVLAAKINAFLNAGPAFFIQGDALRTPILEWARAQHSGAEDGFSIIVGNPPFAGYDSQSLLPYSAQATGSQRGAGSRVNKVVPFIAATLRMLRPGGSAALVVPVSVLNGEASAYADLRRWLSENAEITALLSLNSDAFAHTDCGIEGAILMFRRPADGLSDDGRVYTTVVDDVGYDRRGRPTSTTELNRVVREWRQRDGDPRHWIARDELHSLPRWDPSWLGARARIAARSASETLVPLTCLCSVARRNVSGRSLRPDEPYRVFELRDTDIDLGTVNEVHKLTGAELQYKNRVRLQVRSGDVLLPNHRDSLLAKSGSNVGRSAVLVDSDHDGCMTSNRFTVLEPTRVDPRVLVAVLNSRSVREQLVQQSRGSASFDVRDKTLSSVLIPRRVSEDAKLQQELAQSFDEVMDSSRAFRAAQQRHSSRVDSVLGG